MTTSRPGYSWHLSHIRDLRPMSYLRGLTPARVGVVLLLCTVLSARQLSACMSINAVACVNKLLGGNVLAGSALFVGRRFVSALPILILITMADNATARSSTPARVGAFCVAVVLGAVVYALAFHYAQPAGWIARDGTFSEGTIFLVMQFFQALPYGGLAAALLFYLAHEQRHTRALQDSSLAKLARE